MECLVRFQLALNTNYTLSIDVTKGQRLVVEVKEMGSDNYEQ